MLVRISGEAKNYAWGSKTLIQDNLEFGSPGQTIAEVWFGTHSSGESKVIETSEKLSEAITSKLPFLAKFLAAESPLSIQVHPNPEQAKAGFERENLLGLSGDDPSRNYRDGLHKPEVLVAITPFRALCGFRPKSETEQIFRGLVDLDSRFGELADELSLTGSLEQVFISLLDDLALVNTVSESPISPKPSDSPAVAEARKLLQELIAIYPQDTGALVALMLNLVELKPGQAIFLPAGNLHAYLSGLGFEVMAASDNVIRGGLTPKHVDKQQLLLVSEFTELTNPLLETKKLAEGLVEYPVPVADFKLYRAELSAANLLADIDLPSGAMIVCVDGQVAVGTSLGEREVLRRSEVLYLSGAKKFSLSGSGVVFIVLSGN